MGKSKGRLIIFIALILILIVACTPQKRPEQKEPTDQEPTISLYVAETGETKEIALEEYLYGVVAAEMDPSGPGKPLAAQAIARTFTLVKIEEGGVPAREYRCFNGYRRISNL